MKMNNFHQCFFFISMMLIVFMNLNSVSALRDDEISALKDMQAEWGTQPVLQAVPGTVYIVIAMEMFLNCRSIVLCIMNHSFIIHIFFKS